MKVAFYSILFASLFVFTSCGYESAKFKELKARSDSLVVMHAALESDLMEYLVVLTSLDGSLDNIEAGKSEFIPNVQTKLSPEENTLINTNIDKVNALLQSSRKEVDKLKRQVNQSAFKINQLEQEVKHVSQLLEDEKAKVIAMQEELLQKDELISELNATIRVLTAELENAMDVIEQQNAVITKQENDLNTAYYIIASTSDLKKNNIYTKAGLFKHVLFEEDFRQGAFTKINIQEVKEIEIPASAKGKIMTYHLESSYRITKENKKKTLHITNPEKFWQVSKYLVIE